MQITRIAAIDIGSNAIRLLITDVINYEGKILYKKSSLTRVPIRLGEDTFSVGYITEKKKEKLALAMQAFKSLLQINEIEIWKACATSALREASNREEVVEYVCEKSGMKIEIIDGKKEAQHIFYNRIDEMLDNDKVYLFTDVGGGSTELTILYQGKELASNSFKLGTVRLLQKSDEESEWLKMEEWLRNIGLQHRTYIVGSGGNINKIKSLFGKKGSIRREDLISFYNKLTLMTYEERVVNLKLNLDRADVILPAIKIFLRIMKLAKSPQIIIPSMGIADGIVKQLYQETICK